jgi:hypothetical protein
MWHSLHLGRWDDVITAARRRLAAPELPAIERGDAIHMIAWAHRLRGDPEESLRVALDAIASSRPGDPISHFQSLIWDGVLTAYWSGHWSDLAIFIRVAEEIRQQLQDEWADGILVYAYILWLSVAMAREDRATADAALAIIQRLCRERRQPYLAVAEALRADDPSLLNLDPADLQDGWGLVLWFSNDRGLSVSSDLMQYEQAHDSDEAGPSFVPAALAIRDHDPARLAAAIDQAERAGRIPDVARMRIVLAEMTGDPGPLELARPVLEQLQDRQFLRRLDGVAASLR